ncbi:unnamed protein product, partial [Mesorhabditis belari]|uniref:Uncharacterized protein n=1 Tax=Mesorhabditis belari TaxID=2138241 RepID=A0AAF3EHQ2_9BILA
MGDSSSLPGNELLQAEKDEKDDGPFENRRVNSSEIAPNAEGPFGVRLSDDMLNVFCDRVQLAAPDRINGFFAIQSILCDPASLRSQIQPRQEVIQIFFDQEQEHYITAHLFYVNKVPTLRIYDPLLHAKNVKNRDLKDMMSPSMIRQILDIFGHIVFRVAQPGAVPVEYVHDIDPQTDGWSCGYRAIGVVMDLLRERPPMDSKYDVRSLYDLYIWANRDGSHPWHEFMKFPYRSYRLRNYVRNGIVVFPFSKATESLVAQSEEPTAQPACKEEPPAAHKENPVIDAVPSKSGDLTNGVREMRQSCCDYHLQSNASKNDKSKDAKSTTHHRAMAESSGIETPRVPDSKPVPLLPRLAVHSSSSQPELLQPLNRWSYVRTWSERQSDEEKKRSGSAGECPTNSRLSAIETTRSITRWTNDVFSSEPIECNVPASFDSLPSMPVPNLHACRSSTRHEGSSFHTDSNHSLHGVEKSQQQKPSANKLHQVTFRPHLGYGADEQHSSFEADVSSFGSSNKSVKFDVQWESEPAAIIVPSFIPVEIKKPINCTTKSKDVRLEMGSVVATQITHKNNNNNNSPLSSPSSSMLNSEPRCCC